MSDACERQDATAYKVELVMLSKPVGETRTPDSSKARAVSAQRGSEPCLGSPGPSMACITVRRPIGELMGCPRPASNKEVSANLLGSAAMPARPSRNSGRKSNGGANLGFEQKMRLAADELPRCAGRCHRGLCDYRVVSLPRSAGNLARGIGVASVARGSRGQC